MRVLLYANAPGLIGTVIRWQTRSQYSHAALQFDDGMVIEAREFKGVIARKPELTEPEPAHVYKVNGSLDLELARSFAEAQLGKPYDYSSVARFISRRQESRTASGKWFCSEFVFAVLLKGGVRLLNNIEPWAVSPGLLALSPKLIRI